MASSCSAVGYGALCRNEEDKKVDQHHKNKTLSIRVSPDFSFTDRPHLRFSLTCREV